MADYLVRVEMHGANDAQYTQLHKAMAAANYPRTIKASDGHLYKLPTAEYYITGQSMTAQAVLDEVQGIADKIDPGSWVLVAATSAITWRTELA